MKAIIIEDEKLAADKLERMLFDLQPDIEILEKIGSVEESIKWLKSKKADILFVDIQLSDGLSFSIFEKIKINTPIIFTTAYDQYALRAFKLHSIDYLLKPVRKSDLSEALKKLETYKSNYITALEEMLKSFNSKEVEYKKRFLIQYGQKIKKVEIEEVAYFYAMEKSVYLATHSGSVYPVDYTLDTLQEILDPKEFFRINRKIIVSFKSINNMIPYSRSRIKIDLKPEPPKDIEALVSVERAAEFKSWMDK